MILNYVWMYLMSCHMEFLMLLVIFPYRGRRIKFGEVGGFHLEILAPLTKVSENINRISFILHFEAFVNFVAKTALFALKRQSKQSTSFVVSVRALVLWTRMLSLPAPPSASWSPTFCKIRKSVVVVLVVVVAIAVDVNVVLHENDMEKIFELSRMLNFIVGNQSWRCLLNIALANWGHL